VITVTNVSSESTLQLPDGKTISVPTTPGAFAVLSGDADLFQEGQSAAGTALETLAENGNPEPLIAALAGTEGVKQAGLILQGQLVTIAAEPGDRIAE
jgi:predicted RNase H-like HicB family nuclease